MIRRPAGPPLLPYTTLFRSTARETPLPLFRRERSVPADEVGTQEAPESGREGGALRRRRNRAQQRRNRNGRLPAARSEEHTSELQSHVNLVCRLLLEKKNLHCPIHHAGTPRVVPHRYTGSAGASIAPGYLRWRAGFIGRTQR